MKDSIAGSYWMVADRNGDRAICQGEKPKKMECLDGWKAVNPTMGWITLDNDLYVRARRKDKILSKSDFQDLIFPKISFEESPMEIEIGKSGRVYTYEPEHTKENSKTS